MLAGQLRQGRVGVGWALLSAIQVAGGVSLRLARVRRYRPDKSPGEADGIDAVRAIRPGSG